MITLNLKTKNKSQEQIKEYLEENVSEILAEKINNGVKIQKDNKPLLNKKDLDGFWKYATDEARKQVEKGADGAYVDNETVFGWAIHYFEEDSIEGKLFNEDGTEYKPEIKVATPKSEPPKVEKETNKQNSLFDLLTNTDETKNANNIKNDENYTQISQKTEEKCKKLEKVDYEPDPLFDDDNYLIDTRTGEVITNESKENKNNYYSNLNKFLDGIVKVEV